MIQQYVFNGKLVIKTGRTATKVSIQPSRRRSSTQHSSDIIIYEIRYHDITLDNNWREWVRDEDMYIVDMSSLPSDVTEPQEITIPNAEVEAIIKSFNPSR